MFVWSLPKIWSICLITHYKVCKYLCWFSSSTCRWCLMLNIFLWQHGHQCGWCYRSVFLQKRDLIMNVSFGILLWTCKKPMLLSIYIQNLSAKLKCATRAKATHMFWHSELFQHKKSFMCIEYCGVLVFGRKIMIAVADQVSLPKKTTWPEVFGMKDNDWSIKIGQISKLETRFSNVF